MCLIDDVTSVQSSLLEKLQVNIDITAAGV